MRTAAEPRSSPTTQAPSRAARWIATASLVGAVLTAAPAARAEGRDSVTRFGIVPGVRFGFGLGSAPHRGAFGEISDEFATGYVVEPHVDAVVVFPGDRFGVSLSGGFAWQGLTGADSISYPGVLAVPSFDVGLGRVLFMRLGVGPFFGWVSQPGSDAAFAPGFRAGLEFNVVPFSFSVFEMALGLGLFHTRSLEVDIGPPGDRITTQYASTAALMNAVFTLAPRRR